MKKTKLAIIGSGPSGYSAGIYASRAQLEPTLYSGMESGGQLMYTTEVENFPGFPEGVVGPKLMMQMKEQTEKFGTSIIHDHVTAVDFSQRPFKIWTKLPKNQKTEVYKFGSADEIKALTAKVKQMPHQLEAESVIVATGAKSILLGIPGEKKFMGRGVSTCAVCDAAFFRDKKTYVIGGGDSAMEDALALAKFSDDVTVIHRRDQFRASKIMQERVLNNPKINVMWNSSLKEIRGEEQVKQILIDQDGQEQLLQADGVFLAIGHKPVSAIFSEELKLDQKGYVVTSQSPSQDGIELAQDRLDKNQVVKYPSMTSVPGIFAAGDIVDFRYRQAITAAGLGAAAAIDAERWLEERE
jgi:thioredoxin reductase (NADPH)